MKHVTNPAPLTTIILLLAVSRPTVNVVPVALPAYRGNKIVPILTDVECLLVRPAFSPMRVNLVLLRRTVPGYGTVGRTIAL